MSTTLSAEISKAVSERGCLRTGLGHLSNQSRLEIIITRRGDLHIDQRAHGQGTAGAAGARDTYRAVDLRGVGAGAGDGDIADQVDAVDQHGHPASDLLREPPRADL